MNRSDLIQLISVVVAFIFGLISIWMTRREIRISNRRYLFERRLFAYTLLIDIDNLCSENLQYISLEKSNIFSVEHIIGYITNSSNFYKIASVFVSNTDDNRQLFLLEISKIRLLAEQSKFIFHDKYKDIASNYFDTYSNLIHELYKYKIYMDDVRDLSDKGKIEQQQSLLKSECIVNLIENIKLSKNRLVELHNDFKNMKPYFERDLYLK